MEESSIGDEAEEFGPEETFSDPLESSNRLVFQFNDKLYFWVMKPLAKGYNAVVPLEGRVPIRNAFQNIRMPIRAVSAFLQGKMRVAGIELARFGINSTMGLAGLYDVAKSEFNIKGQEQDLGLTLGYYGIAEGPYLILPFLGPSCLRDAIGMTGGGFLNPLNYIGPPIELVKPTSILIMLL
jgi:phospholipid-binding lipoprotein MlaA